MVSMNICKEYLNHANIQKVSFTPNKEPVISIYGTHVYSYYKLKKQFEFFWPTPFHSLSQETQYRR